MTTERKKWTLMFFFAGDNTLSPSMLSQIKAIKAAGYQKNTNVLLHFDPNEKGAPTRVFEVNRNDSVQNMESRIGDSDKRLASVLTGDDVTPRALNELQGQKVGEVEAEDALTAFLEFCRKSYPAEHYMLFLVGHGMVVGHDTFLSDENPTSAIGLAELGKILEQFSTRVKEQRGTLELIGMHSCSMSGVEVAYQLKNTARYMLASQGISFVGAWPYRQMLIQIFNAIESGAVDVFPLVTSLHDLCIQHSADFMVGGYSADLCLCTLDSENVTKLDEPIENLATVLTNGLADPRRQGEILLAHWQSQSYWQETYTDLYDFCFCLKQLSADESLKAACEGLIKKLKSTPRTRDNSNPRARSVPTQPTRDDGPVIMTDFVGAGYQYSHGLSIYFPWSRPLQDTPLQHRNGDDVGQREAHVDKSEDDIGDYEGYAFAKNSATSAWLSFLKSYFSTTQRKDRVTEDGVRNEDFDQALSNAAVAFSIPGMEGPQSVPSTALDGKVSPPDSGGGGCVCPSIKNHARKFVMSEGAAEVFRGRSSTEPEAAKPASAP